MALVVPPVVGEVALVVLRSLTFVAQPVSPPCPTVMAVAVAVALVALTMFCDDPTVAPVAATLADNSGILRSGHLYLKMSMIKLSKMRFCHCYVLPFPHDLIH